MNNFNFNKKSNIYSHEKTPKITKVQWFLPLAQSYPLDCHSFYLIFRVDAVDNLNYRLLIIVGLNFKI